MSRESYQKATEKLILLATDFDLEPVGRFSFPDIVLLLRNAFLTPGTFSKVFPNEKRLPGADPSQGFCLVASYYIYEHTGGDAVWELRRSPYHWWLQSKQYSGEFGRFDVTRTQFTEKKLREQYEYDIFEDRILPGVDPVFLDTLQQRAMMLGKCAKMEI